jgi:hypothetical protein
MYTSKRSERDFFRFFGALWPILLLAANTASAQQTGSAAQTATQTNESTPASGAATITGSEFGTHTILKGLNERVILTSVDHKPIAVQLLLALNITKTLTPGRHKVHVRYTMGNWVSGGSLWLDAEAGKAYVVRAHREPRGVQFRIEEVATGKIVGGIDPGEDFKDELPPAPGSEPPSSMTTSASNAASSKASAPVASSPTASNP